MKRNLQRALLLLSSIFLASCDPLPPTTDAGGRAVYDLPATHEGHSRFQVQSQGSFQAGHDNTRRELLIITDTFTAKKYFGITGVGVTEMRTESTTTVDAEGNATVTYETRER